MTSRVSSLLLICASAHASHHVEQVNDCLWFATLSTADAAWYVGLFNPIWFYGLTPAKRCAYAGAVKDFEEFLDSHPIADATGTALAPLLLRQAFHSSGTFDLETGTGGSNGGTIRFDEELEDPDNACIKGASVATAAAFAKRYAFVTQADSLVLGAYVALRRMGFPQMSQLAFTGGRFDTPWHIVYRHRLPSTEENSVKNVFVDRMGFTPKEATALVGGAHNFGGSHAQCSGYVSNWTSSPTVWTIDTNGSEFFRNLMENDWKFFEVCSYLNGTEIRNEKENPFSLNFHAEEDQEEEGGSGYTLAMYLNQEPFVCESQFINSRGLMMLVSDFYLREAEDFKDFSAYYAADPTDQLAFDFAAAFTKLVNLGLDRCGMFGSSCSSDEVCVEAAGTFPADVYVCQPRENTTASNACSTTEASKRVPIWAIAVMAVAAVALLAALIALGFLLMFPAAARGMQKDATTKSSDAEVTVTTTSAA
ncbi:hypothetical protein AB1Y20_018411 [Prymnesium parvum]|uniref:Plant heme peroxidase family profile domain-containing protein n=1 Tax=Prymnesium parvum TaxID=97485 RepID=A0AB34JNM0_PRYPA